MIKSNHVLVAGAALLLAAGCVGHANIHYQDTQGGVLTLQGNEGKALEDAQAKMAAHCGVAGYQIVKRETVVVGQENYTHARTDYQEREDSQRTEDTIGESHEENQYGYDHQASSTSDSGSYDGAYQDHAYQDSEAQASGGGYSTTDQGYQESTVEDQSVDRAGTQTNQQVSGTRNVTEARVHYVCGTARTANR